MRTSWLAVVLTAIAGTAHAATSPPSPLEAPVNGSVGGNLPEAIVPLSQVSTLPRPIAGMISDSDYPPAALRREAQGQTRAHLLITSNGQVSHCQIAKSSGHQDLDRRVCDLAVMRMRFSPALDETGRPVAVKAILPVNWLIGDPPVVNEPSEQ